MEKAFTEMVNQNRGTIYKVCNLYSREEEYKRDLFQEIVLQLWKSYPSFRQEANESTWIYRVAINTAISNFRKEKNRMGQSRLTPEHLQIPDIFVDPGGQEKLDELFQAIHQLNELEKAIILLYLDEKSYEDMAVILGISPTNVGVRLNRIKSKLTTLIQKKQ